MVPTVEVAVAEICTVVQEVRLPNPHIQVPQSMATVEVWLKAPLQEVVQEAVAEVLEVPAAVPIL
jgi:hypothetical protein